jgi:hypothetical protein
MTDKTGSKDLVRYRLFSGEDENGESTATAAVADEKVHENADDADTDEVHNTELRVCT